MYTTDHHGTVASGSLNPSKNLKQRCVAPQVPPAPEPAQNTKVSSAVDVSNFQVLVSGIYFCTVFLLSIIPSTAEWARALCSVQYTATVHGRSVAYVGVRDVGVVVSSCMAVVAFRALCFRLFVHLAPYFSIKRGKSAVRFAEQAWCVLHYGTMALIGSLLLHQSTYSWNPQLVWNDYPHIYMDVGLKVYYLYGLAHWIAQVYVIHAEERRKDHYQMLFHHFVTCLLVAGSYYYHYTRIGHLIMIIMDGVDVVLSVAKCLKYTGYNRACDVTFLVFLVTWLAFRHGLYIYQLYYAWVVAPATLADKCKLHQFWGTEVCYDKRAHDVFGVLLCILQVVTFFWLWMIMKVVVRVVKGNGAEDTRSDDED